MEIAHPATTVLLIDGHKQDREYWAQRLNISSPDYVVLEADTGASGLAICKSQRVDCVVVELDLPDMSGFKVLLDLVPRFRYPEIAVIILSRLRLRYQAGTHSKICLKGIQDAYESEQPEEDCHFGSGSHHPCIGACRRHA
jgi:CheY-like chemotaxis protein